MFNISNKKLSIPNGNHYNKENSAYSIQSHHMQIPVAENFDTKNLAVRKPSKSIERQRNSISNVVYMKKKTNKFIANSNKRRVRSCQPNFYKKAGNFINNHTNEVYHRMTQSFVFNKPQIDDEFLGNTKKIVYFQFGLDQKVRVIISEKELTVGWLYCECTRKMLQFVDSQPSLDSKLNFKIEDFIMLKTKEKIFNLDYLLTKSDQTCERIPNGLVLKPYIKKHIDEQLKNTIQNYEILTKIGDGGFSQVYLVRKKDDGGILAMKVLDREKIPKRVLDKFLNRERQIWTQTQSKFCCNLYYAFYNKFKIFFVNEYCPGGD